MYICVYVCVTDMEEHRGGAVEEGKGFKNDWRTYRNGGTRIKSRRVEHLLGGEGEDGCWWDFNGMDKLMKRIFPVMVSVSSVND